jgi:hypothetical protein
MQTTPLFKKPIPTNYENLLNYLFGDWKTWNSTEMNGVLGVLIIRCILDGVRLDLHVLASHLGVGVEELRPAFMRFSFNGVFQRNRLRDDRKNLNANDLHAWCYYAGIASGATGTVMWTQRDVKR